MSVCMCEYVCVARAAALPGSGLAPLHTHCRMHATYTWIQCNV